MRRPRRRSARTAMAVAVVPLLALILAGCGRAEAGGDAAGSGGESLEDYLGAAWSDGTDWAAASRQVEEAAATCMKAEGFEYVPVDWAAMEEQFGAMEDMTHKEYAETYGYGLTMGFSEQEAVSAPTDPNAEIYDALTPAEQQAYDRALWGELPDTGVGDEMVEMGGCMGTAQEEVFGGVSPEVQDALDSMYDDFETHPDYVRGLTAWSECMRAAGYDVSSPEDPYTLISEKLDALLPDQPAGDVEAEETESPVDPLADPAIDQAALAELRDEERRMAVADAECTEEHLGDELYERIFADLEGEFVAEHRDLLERERAAAEG